MEPLMYVPARLRLARGVYVYAAAFVAVVAAFELAVGFLSNPDRLGLSVVPIYAWIAFVGSIVVLSFVTYARHRSQASALLYFTRSAEGVTVGPWLGSRVGRSLLVQPGETVKFWVHTWPAPYLIWFKKVVPAAQWLLIQGEHKRVGAWFFTEVDDEFLAELAAAFAHHGISAERAEGIVSLPKRQ